MKAFIAVLLFSFSALAHEGGHGPQMPGTGPKGGLLTAVVDATDIEMNENAPVYAVAEWFKQNQQIEIDLWNITLTEREPIAAGDLKWIFLLKAPMKPIVVVQPQAQPTSRFKFEVDDVTNANLETVEVILPALANRAGKHVFAFSVAP